MKTYWLLNKDKINLQNDEFPLIANAGFCGHHFRLYLQRCNGNALFCSIFRHSVDELGQRRLIKSEFGEIGEFAWFVPSIESHIHSMRFRLVRIHSLYWELPSGWAMVRLTHNFVYSWTQISIPFPWKNFGLRTIILFPKYLKMILWFSWFID